MLLYCTMKHSNDVLGWPRFWENSDPREDPRCSYPKIRAQLVPGSSFLLCPRCYNLVRTLEQILTIFLGANVWEKRKWSPRTGSFCQLSFVTKATMLEAGWETAATSTPKIHPGEGPLGPYPKEKRKENFWLAYDPNRFRGIILLLPWMFLQKAACCTHNPVTGPFLLSFSQFYEKIQKISNLADLGHKTKFWSKFWKFTYFPLPKGPC